MPLASRCSSHSKLRRSQLNHIVATAGHSKTSNSDAMVVLLVYHSHDLWQRRCAHCSLLIMIIQGSTNVKNYGTLWQSLKWKFCTHCYASRNIIIATFYPNGCNQFETPEAPDFEKLAPAARSVSILSLPTSRQVLPASTSLPNGAMIQTGN